MIRKFSITLICIACLAMSLALVKNWSIADNNKVAFKVGMVSGTIGGLRGTVSYDPDDLAHSNLDVTLDVPSIATGLSKRDKDIKEEAVWFNAAKFPTISFKSGTVTKTATGYMAAGMLTMKGVAKKVQIPFTFDGSTFSGTLKLNRLDYGVGMSTIMVKDTVEVTITVPVKK